MTYEHVNKMQLKITIMCGYRLSIIDLLNLRIAGIPYVKLMASFWKISGVLWVCGYIPAYPRVYPYIHSYVYFGVFFSVHNSNNCCSLTKCERYVSQGSVETLFR